ncbi:D-alanyl-D-alanine carboxypeptidase [Gammaproteobacteria bacterium]|nr:D-alanyl-D-alanine carboxypeptidase [Gammaproteobacteria bacterium]MDC3313850.1 D-alanyl-D-alanine carboxypeptidase [Gammaproteobacteria bacterium]
MKKLLIPLLITNIIYAQSFVPDAPELDLKSYILIEPNTNTVIAEFNSDSEIEPASMTKIMTSYVVADQIANDLISLDDQVLISEKAWRMEGSKMFIEAGKKVSVSDLLKGIIIQSGNDASVAIAEYAGGTERGFVDLMNAYAGSLSMNNTIFKNSTGLPDENHFSSAKDLATLTSDFIKKFPDIYSLYKEKQFTFNNIKQLNRNKLLWRDDSSDGVKTGHTEAAGYCLVGSAKRGDMRLITVVAGSDSDNNRFLASQRLLEYGFRFFATQKVLIANQEYKNINIWGGLEKSVSLGVLEDISITLPRTSFKDLTVNYNYINNIQAPIEIGQTIGTLEIVSNDEIVFSTELVALQSIKSKGFFGRLWSKFVLWIFSLFGMTDNGTN